MRLNSKPSEVNAIPYRSYDILFLVKTYRIYSILYSSLHLIFLENSVLLNETYLTFILINCGDSTKLKKYI